MNVRVSSRGGGRSVAALYISIIVLTLVCIEVASFGFLWTRAIFGGEKIGVAASSLIKLHPWLNTAIPFGFYDPLVLQRYGTGSMTGRVGVNAHGFVHNGHDDPLLNSFPQKPPSVRRIILFGGSSMAGNALRSDDTQTISAYLERMLNSGSENGEKYQVFNFGVSGDFSSIEMTRFLTEAIHLEPDVIISLDGWNDAVAVAFEHERMNLPHPLLNWGNLAYQYYDRMLGLGTQTSSPPVLFTFTFLALESFGILRPKAPDRLTAYKSNSIFAVSKYLIDKNNGLSFLLAANNSVIAAYAENNHIGYIGYLQPFAGYRRLKVDSEEAMLEERHALLSKVNGSTWARMTYKAATEGVYGRYHEDFQKLDDRYDSSNHVVFYDITDLFAKTDETVYLDQIHYNDRGNEIIAQKFARDIRELLSRKSEFN